MPQHHLDCDTSYCVYQLLEQEKNIEFKPIAIEEDIERARERAKELAQEKNIPTSSLVVAPEHTKPFPSFQKAMRLVKKHQRSYVEDFYWHDINKFLKHTSCVWGIRPSGTVLLPLDSEQPLSEKEKVFQLEYASYYLENVDHIWYIWTEHKIRKITLEEARKKVYAFLK